MGRPKRRADHGVVRARESGETRCIGYSGDNDAAMYAVTCDILDALQISVKFLPYGSPSAHRHCRDNEAATVAENAALLAQGRLPDGQ